MTRYLSSGFLLCLLAVSTIPVLVLHDALHDVKASSGPDFTISESTNALAIPLGDREYSIVSVTSVNGFSGTVNLVATPSSNAFICQWTLYNTITADVGAGGQWSFQLTCRAGNAAGYYSLNITGTSGSLSHSLIVPVDVTDYSLSGPATVSLNAGSVATEMITASSLDGFSGRIPLNVTAPHGLSASCPSSLTLSQGATLTAACQLASPTQGNYEIAIAGSFLCDLCSGSPLIRSQTTSIAVSGPSVPGFEVSSRGVTVTTGYSNVANVTFTSVNGFSGSLVLSTATPQGIAASAAQTTLNLQLGATATAAMKAASTDCELGRYTVLFTGTSGSQSYFTSVPVIVSPQNPMQDQGYGYYDACASPTALNVSPGLAGNATVTVVAANGGLGSYQVDLKANSYGSLISCRTFPSILNFTSTVTALSSTLSCNSTTPGNYTVDVIASWSNPFHCNSPSCIPPPDPATTVARVTYTVENSSTSIGCQANFQGVSVTITGSASGSSGTFSGTFLVTATNSSTGAVLFSKAYSITNLPVNGNQAMFLLNVGISPYPLSANIAIRQTGGIWSAAAGLNRQIDILAHGTVDISDIVTMAISYDLSAGNPGYSPSADILGRGTIDIIDIATAAIFFGATDYS